MSDSEIQTFDRKDVAKVLQHIEGLTEAQAIKITNLVFASIVWALLEKKRVAIPNFGVIKVVDVPPRIGFHPQKLESFNIPASVRLKFRMAKSVKSLLLEKMQESNQDD